VPKNVEGKVVQMYLCCLNGHWKIYDKETEEMFWSQLNTP
jgi:hypothetical protein